MRMNEPTGWPVASQERRAEFEALLKSGRAIEVTHRAPKWFSGPVAIDTSTYDRFVSWDGEAQRRLLLHLDEALRLAHLLEACGIAIGSTGGCFICKAVDATSRCEHPQREVLTLTNYGAPTEPAWLIHG